MLKFKFSSIQQLGRALMLPIALLPIAGLLLRFGQPDLLNIKYIADAGNVIFTNLPILFAMGVAVGLAKDNNGTAALASAVGYFIMTTILTSINKDINTGVLGGILIGAIAASLYNRYKDIKLPEFLAFFGGKRFVPIITGIAAVFVGILLGYIWPPIQDGLNTFGFWLLKSGEIGLFIYGVLNRILLVAGLHHVLNNLVWFVFGSYPNASGIMVHGDIARFMSGDPAAGGFMAGWFPVFMFGLPAACLAMYKNALPENKKAVAGLLVSMALTSILTGVTEPIEYSFVFLAPLLFLIHAVFSGISMALMYTFNVHLGFTFSAGLIDYLLFFKQGTNPLYLFPIGVVFFILYYIIFDFCIRRFNLVTIGRDATASPTCVNPIKADSRALQFIEALGGVENLIEVDACTTRLRLVVRDSSHINRPMLMAIGTRGILAPSVESLQIILGPIADLVASEIREALILNNAAPISKPHDVHFIRAVSEESSFSNKLKEAGIILNAFGGVENITSVKLAALTRLLIQIKDESFIDLNILSQLKSAHISHISNVCKQLYLGDEAALIFTNIDALLNNK